MVPGRSLLCAYKRTWVVRVAITSASADYRRDRRREHERASDDQRDGHVLGCPGATARRTISDISSSVVGPCHQPQTSGISPSSLGAAEGVGE